MSTEKTTIYKERAAVMQHLRNFLKQIGTYEREKSDFYTFATDRIATEESIELLSRCSDPRSVSFMA